MVDHVDTSGEAKMLRKEEAMFRLRILFLFTSLDKYCDDGIFLLTMNFFLVYIEVSSLGDNLFG